ncbi:MAG: 2-phospho-L-lactate guanylyltransferase [bacterium]
MTLPILIPVNRLDRAKGRLASVLSAEERESLALITLETVLHAAGPESIVLTADARVVAAVAGKARVLQESPETAGLNPQLEFALATLIADGTAKNHVLILHADLPLATNEAIENLAAMARPNSITVVESRDGGTNAMLLQPPGRFALAYGPGSFAKHTDAARRTGMRVHTNPNRELRLDLDTPDDILELLRPPRGRQGAAGRYLLSIGIEERLKALA